MSKFCSKINFKIPYFTQFPIISICFCNKIGSILLDGTQEEKTLTFIFDGRWWRWNVYQQSSGRYIRNGRHHPRRYTVQFRVARGHLRVARGQFRVARGHLRVATGQYRVARGQLRVARVQYRVAGGSAYGSYGSEQGS